MLSTPILFINSSPAFSPYMPAILSVPASNLSGRKSGTVSKSETLPVPPLISGSISGTVSSLIINPPVPWGPSRDLWPVKQRMSMFILSISTFTLPPLWAQSAINISPCFLHISPIFSMGAIVPHTLDAWENMTAFVLSLMSSSTPKLFPSESQGALSK